MRQAEVIRSARWSFTRFHGLPLLAVLALGLLGAIPSVGLRRGDDAFRND